MRKKENWKKKWIVLFLAAAAALGNFGAVEAASAAEEETEQETEQIAADFEENIPEIEGLTYESSMDLEYAERFAVYYYNDGYGVIDVFGSDQYLVVPEDMPVPENLDPDITVLQKPLDHVYLTATSVMSFYDALGAVDDIKMSGTQASGWYIDSAVEALENGSMLFAGKYSAPDFELLIDQGCDLSIQSTMISHAPKIKEMLEALGIPVFVEYSTYETQPLGKTEWIRLFGFLADKEEEADAFMTKEKDLLAQLDDFQNTEKTVAYFYVHSNGQVVVREVDDYIPTMIEMAGARYIFQDPIVPGSGKSTASISMEEFYNAAVNADYLVYNASIDSPISSIDDLLAKSSLFADFKAVKEGNVWCTGKSMFQRSDKIAECILDLHRMVTGSDGSDMTFFSKVK